jgi:hypothetical protein
VFLVHHPTKAGTFLVFLHEDPATDAPVNLVECDVLLDCPEDDYYWPDGSAWPEGAVGRSKKDSRLYSVFRNADELRAAGFQLEPGSPVVFQNWAKYQESRRMTGMPD